MKDCTCGRNVRLRANIISVNRKRGVAHWIEHMDGTRVCVLGDWGCAALKPYAKVESERPSRKLVALWDETVSMNAGATTVDQGATESAQESSSLPETRR